MTSVTMLLCVKEAGNTLPEDKNLNGVDVKAVEDLINLVNEQPDLGQCKFRVNNEWLDGGHSRES